MTVVGGPAVLPMVLPPQLEAKRDAAQLSLAPKKEVAPKKDKEKKKQGDQAAATSNNVLPADEDDVVRVDTNLVALDVLAVDKEGRFINGLTGKDFVVKEDGELQTVATFALGDDPNRARTIILIIDYSGSSFPSSRTVSKRPRLWLLNSTRKTAWPLLPMISRCWLISRRTKSN